MNPESLSDLELLSLLMGEREATKTYKRSLASLFTAGAVERDMHPKIAAAKELVKRVLSEQMQNTMVLPSTVAVRDFIRLHFLGKEYEAFVVLFLDVHCRIIEAEEIFRGTLMQTSVYPREVVKRALRLNAAAVILAHNHPSGVAEPSRADEMLTQSLKSALGLVDVRVLDHIVVAGSALISLAERGLL